MHWHLNMGKYRCYLALTSQHTAVGINSAVYGPDGEEEGHAPMWDFDNTAISKVVDSLAEVQELYHLGNILIIHTGAPDHFHAYCDSVLPWAQCIAAVTDTPYCDRAFRCIAYMRGYLTLRISPKRDRRFTTVATLPAEGMWPTTKIDRYPVFQAYYTSKR